MVRRVSVIGPPGTGKTYNFVLDIKDKINDSVATSVTLSPVIEIASRLGLEAKKGGLRTIYGLAESNLLNEGLIGDKQALYLVPTINHSLKRKVARQLGLRYKNEIETVSEYGTFDTVIHYYTKAIMLKGDYNAVYEFANEYERFGIRHDHLDKVYKLYKEKKYYDYSFLILDALKHEINIAKQVRGTETYFFKYAFVDEAQDLGKIPYELLKNVEDQFEEFKLFGDPAQSIYGFLGASPEIMLNHGEHVVLNPTRRFGKEIAEYGNELLKKMRLPYRIEYTEDKNSKLIFLPYRSTEIIRVVRTIFSKAPNWSVAVLTRTNRQAENVRYLLSHDFVPMPIKESQRKTIETVYRAVKYFVEFKKTGDASKLKHIERYLDIENGITKYFKLDELRNKSVSFFLYLVEKKLFNRRVELIERLITKLLQGYKTVYVDTIHSAKGLEFDAVIVIDEIPPLARSLMRENLSYLHEELRVFYTGVTRAKRILIITKSPDGYSSLV